MTKPLISLCMIVKNEEELLEKCLTSVKGLADEIVIVDTGSTDRTIEIAESFQAIVLHYEWNNDFATARNVGISKAKGKWILILDADEVVDQSIHKKLRKLAKKYQEGIFVFKVKNYLDDTYTNLQVNDSARMVRNKPTHRYRGKIHEQISDSILEENPKTPIYMTSFSIFHYGYMKDQLEKKDKKNRNLTSLKEAIKEKPNDFFYLYYLGVEYMRLSDMDNAALHFQKARLHCNTITPVLAVVYKLEAICLFQMEKTNEALILLEDGIKRFPTYTDLFHNLGLMYKKLNKYEEAKNAFLKATELGTTTEFETQSGIGTYLTYFLLGKMAEDYELYEDALCFFEQSLSHAGNSPSIQTCIDRVKNKLL